MNPEQWLSLKWNDGSTMSDRWLNQSKIIQIKYSCQNDFIHGFKKLSHISLHAFMFYDSVVL